MPMSRVKTWLDIMAKPRSMHAPHWGTADVTLGDTYGSPFGGDVYKCPPG
jgi:hypothetical protein